jgi:hypothetical protein
MRPPVSIIYLTISFSLSSSFIGAFTTIICEMRLLTFAIYTCSGAVR